MQRSRRVWNAPLNLALFAALALAAMFAVSPPASSADDFASVPDVTSKTRADGVALLQGQGFLVATIEVAGNPPDTIEAQMPTAGTQVPRGAPVTIFVRRTVTISTSAPSALKLTPAAANAALGSVYNLKFVPTTGAPADRGTITAQIPSAGQPLDFRGVLELRFVPDTSLPSKVTAPDVVGLNGADAQKALAAVGLNARVAQMALPGTPADITTGQMPGPGTLMNRYDTMDLIVTIASTGPAPTPTGQTTVPNLTSLTESSARAELEKAGLTAEVEWVTGDASMVFLVQSTEPGPTTQVPVGSTVRLRIVKYAPSAPPTPPAATEVAVPSVINLSQSQAEALLLSVGLQPNPILVENPGVVPFRVYAMQLVPGTYVPLGTSITFKVAKPPAPPEPVPVPNFYGSTKSQALETAALAGLSLDFDYVSAPGYPVHLVFSQSVAAGSVVPVGTTVQLQVAKYGGGVGAAVVPNLDGQTWGQANSLLGAAGLGANGSYSYSGSHPAYRVFQQNYAPGSSVPVGTVVQFLVAKPAAAFNVVPNVYGMTQAQTNAAIAAAGLIPDLNLTATGSYPAWRAFWQSPGAGSSVPAGTVVHVKIATPGGGGLVHVPNLIGLTLAQANAQLASAGLGSSGATVFSFGKPLSRVYSQSHTPGTWVPAGTVITWRRQPP